MTVGEAAVKAIKLFGGVWRRKVILKAGTNVTITESVSDDESTLTIAASGGGSGAPTDAQYVTLATNATLTNERVLTAGHGVDLVDAGAGSTITVDVDETELDHSAITTGMGWSSSGHTGTASRLAGFNGGGAAAYYQIGVDVQAYSSILADLVSASFAPSDIEIRCDANPTLATGYEVVRGYLRTAHVYNCPTARTIAAASPEYGWTWANRTNLTTANENTTKANGSYGKVTTTNSDWWISAQTAAFRYQTLVWDWRPMEFIGLIYSNGAANYESVDMAIVSDSAATNFLRVGVGSNAGTPGIFCFTNSATRVTITSGQRDAGVWFRVVLAPTSAGVGILAISYNVTASASPPTTWTRLDQMTITLPPFASLRWGNMWVSTNTAGNLAGGALWMGARYLDRPPFEMTAPAFFHGRQFDTSAAAQTLIASFDLGTPGAAISDTELRAALAAAENHADDDSGATWTYSAVRGSSASPAAGSYAAAASVSVSGTGRYFALYAKCTSDGTTHGSFNLGAFRLRATV